MFVSGANCDIYVGKDAGDQLLKEMYRAKESIDIVSPYLSPWLISELIRLNDKNLKVQLITTDEIEDYKKGAPKNIYRLIDQHMHTDQEALATRDKLIRVKKLLLYSIIGILIAITSMSFAGLTVFPIYIGVIAVLVTLLGMNHLSNAIKNKRIYTYTYSQLFPFKVFMSPHESEQSDTFIHSKIYIIDKKIAYLGSLNFTSSGTKFNYETSIRTQDSQAISALIKEFNLLMNNTTIPVKDTQGWGSTLYPEPIN